MMRKTLVTLAVIAALGGCASGPAYTTETEAKLTQLQAQMSADWSAGKFPNHETLEATYAVEYNKIYPLNALGYETMNFRIETARRIDRGEITWQQGDLLMRQRTAAVRSQVNAQASTDQKAVIDSFMKAVGVISAAGLAYAASQPHPAAPTPAVLCRQTYAGVLCQ